MKTIWKFQAPIKDTTEVYMPKGAKVLTVQIQGHDRVGACPIIWALVDNMAEMEPRRFAWRGTGHDALRDGDEVEAGMYVGTVQMESGKLVFHLFELK